MERVLDDFLSSTRGLVQAPAGCGKTELIALAVGRLADSRSLVLTHTHAGVRALRSRLARHQVPHRAYQLDTIAGWALKHAASFPRLSGVDFVEPEGAQWSEVYDGCRRLFSTGLPQEILRASYGAVFLDEYQDCSRKQHDLVQAISDALPCRVVGDPLQAIFDFDEDLPLSWRSDVGIHFEHVGTLSVPRRWSSQQALGAWLLELRPLLEGGEEVDLTRLPSGASWRRADYSALFSVCSDLGRDANDRVLAIHKTAAQCHRAARQLGKLGFTSAEELESRDLRTWAAKFESVLGPALGAEVLEFARVCFAGIREGDWKRLHSCCKRGKSPSPESFAALPDVARSLSQVGPASDAAALRRALEAIGRAAGCPGHRRELWWEMVRATRAVEDGLYASVSEAARGVRDRTRRFGRKPDRRLVSRTFLVKGQEFDRVVILEAHLLDNARQFYVAMTRGSKSVLVMSNEPRVQFAPAVS